MANANLERLCDLASRAHTRLQQDYQQLDPVIGVSGHMRSHGVPADVITIECVRSRRLIILILHDQQPDTLRYQFSSRLQEPADRFDEVGLDEVSDQTLYDWMAGYFSSH